MGLVSGGTDSGCPDRRRCTWSRPSSDRSQQSAPHVPCRMGRCLSRCASPRCKRSDATNRRDWNPFDDWWRTGPGLGWGDRSGDRIGKPDHDRSGVLPPTVGYSAGDGSRAADSTRLVSRLARRSGPTRSDDGSRTVCAPQIPDGDDGQSRSAKCHQAYSGMARRSPRDGAWHTVAVRWKRGVAAGVWMVNAIVHITAAMAGAITGASPLLPYLLRFPAVEWPYG